MAVPAPRFEALYSGDDYCGAFVGPVVVLVGRDLPGPLLPDHGRVWTKRLKTAYPSGCAFMIVLRSEAPPANEETRKRVAGFFEGCAKSAVAGAVVIEGRGFIAASIRGFFSAFVLVTGYRFILKVYGSVADAAPAIMSKLGRNDPVEAAELQAGIEALKVAYAAGKLRVLPIAG